MEKERRVDEAFIGGIIGLALLLIGYNELGVLEDTAKFFVAILISFFLGVGFLRIYGILVDSYILQWFGQLTVKVLVVPITPLTVAGIVLYQLPSVFDNPLLLLVIVWFFSILLQVIMGKRTLKEPLPKPIYVIVKNNIRRRKTFEKKVKKLFHYICQSIRYSDSMEALTIRYSDVG